MTGPPRALAASVLQRLLNLARERQEDYNALLARYVTERLLFRLASSPEADRFVLKGAWLFHAWKLGRRATRDADLLGSGDADAEAVEALFRDVVVTEVEPDGVTFDLATLRTRAIRGGAACPGVRVRVQARIGSARVHAQIDIGFGDALVSAPEVVEIPALLDFPTPSLRAYSLEATIAEKAEAIVRLGTATSRFKDFFDLAVLASERELDGALLRDQIRATFGRRGTAIPERAPDALRPDFARDAESQRQWLAFLSRSDARGEALESFASVVQRLRELLLPALEAARADAPIPARWIPPTGWTHG